MQKLNEVGLKSLVIIEDVSDFDKWERLEVENVLEYLINRYQRMPETAKLYKGHIASITEINIRKEHIEKTVNEILKCEETIFFVIYPAGGIAALWIITIAMGAFAIYSYFELKNALPSAQSLENRTFKSPNNDLGERTNAARLNGRIPDVFGRVVSIPDLVMLPFKRFIDNIEYEHSFMIIGKGEYGIENLGTVGSPVWNIKEGDTLVSEIDQNCVTIWGPYTSPNRLSDEPILTIGTMFNRFYHYVNNYIRSNNVDGIVLHAFNEVDPLLYSGDMTLDVGTLVLTQVTPSYDFRSFFKNGNTYTLWLQLQDPNPLNPPLISMIGNTEVSDVSAYSVTLNDVESFSNWATFVSTFAPNLDRLYGFYATTPTSDWFRINTMVDAVYCNIVAPNGLYKDNGTDFIPFPIQVKMEIQRIDLAGNPIGAIDEFTNSLNGSTESDLYRGITMSAALGDPTYVKVRLSRLTNTDTSFAGTVVDEIKWKDLYGCLHLEDDYEDFGNVTSVDVMTKINNQAIVPKERKLNLKVTRKIPLRISGDVFTPLNYETLNAADILCFAALDPKIGNRSISELDVDNIYDTVEEALEMMAFKPT